MALRSLKLKDAFIERNDHKRKVKLSIATFFPECKAKVYNACSTKKNEKKILNFKLRIDFGECCPFYHNAPWFCAKKLDFRFIVTDNIETN